jgi:hypothetical protein
MKYRATTLFALMLVMGAFLFPTSVFAAVSDDTTPPSVTAVVIGDLLRVNAIDDSSGVDAVFINGRRVNYRVNGSVDLSLSDYAGTDEFINVYAVDYAGNISETVMVMNPLYNPPVHNESAIPDNGLRPFTPPGTGTVLDNPTDGDGKEFFSIKTPDENVFYLIIDRQRTSENVYLLNAVTEQDLMSLATKSNTPNVSAIPSDPEPNPTATTVDPTPEPEPPPAKGGGNGSLILIIIVAIAAGGTGYYFKILRPKQLAEDDDDEDYEDDTDEDSNDEVYDDSDDEDELTAAIDSDDDSDGIDFEPDEAFRSEE